MCCVYFYVNHDLWKFIIFCVEFMFKTVEITLLENIKLLNYLSLNESCGENKAHVTRFSEFLQKN